MRQENLPEMRKSGKPKENRVQRIGDATMIGNMCKQKVSIGCAICKGRSESAGKQSIARFRRERSKPCWSARNTYVSIHVE